MKTHKPKILIVDDRVENLIALEEVLEDLNVEFIRALSGNEAVAKSLRSEFALILMDVQMPEIDGFEAVQLIRKDKTNENTPVVFISAIYSDDYYKIKGVKAGGVDFITKPLVEDILIGKVQIFLKQYDQKLNLQEAIKKANALAVQAQEASHAKSEFLSNVNHEFRTPMTSILALSKKLAENAEGNLTEEQVEFASTIYGSGQDLMDMVNDLLAITKVEAAKIEMNVESVNLRSFVGQIETQYRPMAASKDLSFQVELEDGLQESIDTDSRRLLQIMRNLLSNAIKFTLKGGIILRISQPVAKADVSHPEDKIAISVEDSGIGIPGDKFKDIFEAFSQVDGSITRQFGGTGVGLAICRIFSSLLGGSIQVTSIEGKGSTFTLYLPRQLTIQSTSKQEVSFSESNDIFQGRKILMVDDDKRIRRIFHRLLTKEGMDVLVSENGQEGLKTLNEHPDVALVLMDVMMPVMDGYTAMKEIRKLKSAIRNVPIIAVTGNATEENRQTCTEAGANAQLTKPVDLYELLAMIRKLITPGHSKDGGTTP